MKIYKNIRIAFALISILWLVYFVNLILPVDLRLYGLKPRDLGGLWGILAAPFLHADIHHLTANTGVLFILLAVALSYNRSLAFRKPFKFNPCLVIGKLPVYLGIFIIPVVLPRFYF